MSTIILKHEVRDFDAWKPHYDSDAPRRQQAGIKEIAVGTDSSNPNMVYILWEGDEQQVHKMLQDPALAEKMQEAGVTSKPELTIIST